MGSNGRHLFVAFYFVFLVYTVDDELSALSEHSSDEQGLPPPIPTHPSVIMADGGGEVEGDDDSLTLTPSEAEDGNPVTSTMAPSPNMVAYLIR